METPPGAATTPKNAIRKIDFRVIGTCRWQIDGARDERGKEVLTLPPDGRPFELLFFLACRPEMQATRSEIKDYFWQKDNRPDSPDNILKTWLTQLTRSGKLPGGEAWQRLFPVETTPDFVRLKEGCDSDAQEFWKMGVEAQREHNGRRKKAKIDRMREIELQQLLPRPLWHWVARLRREMRETIEALEKTLPEVLPAEDLPSPGELPGNLTYPRNPYFEGREGIFAILCEQMTGRGISPQIQALTALGGMGKTETTVEFAYRCFDKAAYPHFPSYNRFLWARADDEDALRNGYAAIARALPDFPYRDESDIRIVVPAVIRWLADPKYRGWLLILDNADSADGPDLVREFLPRYPDRRQGQVLLTSRSQTFPGDIHHIALEPLQAEEALDFLYHRTGRDRRESEDEVEKARAITQELGGLSLALEQTAAYLQQHPALRFADYLTVYRKGRKELLEFRAKTRPYQSHNTKTGHYEEDLTVWTTWDLNFQEIAEHFPQSAALLTLSAFLAPAPIPCELIYAACPDDFAAAESEEEKAGVYGDLLKPLHDYSLIKILSTERAFSIHQMVQTVVWDKLKPEEQQRAYEQMLTAMVRSFPSEDYVLGGRGALYYSHAEQICLYAAQIGTEGEQVGLLLNHMGVFLDRQGRIAEAEPLLKQALAILEQALPPDHLDIAASLQHLAELYRSQGRFEEAELHSLQALAVRQKRLPADHPDIAISLLSLAELYRDQGRFDEAKPHYLRAVEINKSVLPADHPDIAVSLNNLALLYWHQGRFAEAEPLLRQALEIYRKAFSEGHPDIAASLNNLAVLHQSQGDFAEAELLLNEALAIRRKVLPEGHHDIAQSLNNLGMLYRRQGRFAEAEPLYLQALAVWKKMLPADHPSIAVSLNNLAALYRSQGRFEEAEPLLKRAGEIYRKAYAEGHPEIAANLNHLALLYGQQGRFAEAEVFFLEATTMWRKALPEGHPDIAAGLNHLAMLYRSQRRFVEAEPLLKEAESSMLSMLSREHPDYQVVLKNYLTCLMEMQNEAEAEHLSPGFPASYHASIKNDG